MTTIFSERPPFSRAALQRLRLAAYARLGALGTDESVAAIRRVEQRLAPATAVEIGSDPLRVALFARFVVTRETQRLHVEIGHDRVPIDGHDRVSYGVDADRILDGRSMLPDPGPLVGWHTRWTRPDAAVFAVCTSRRNTSTAPVSPAVAIEATDLLHVRRTDGRWVVVGHRWVQY